uniref:Uncharacterized protein AlNc14C12G1430 n=1 Tax=Albugo laibachii Nc14 TaxID=890382 RepID=F0W352_9STRA|nr:conserved hypothetical protein [Albugo laibachii Nc14]|eukprot:CCA15492.1 conserved hypothetical protein [Albugo laibachii Nc14]
MRDSGAITRMTFGDMNATDDTGKPIKIWLLSSKDVNGKTHFRVAGRLFSQTNQTWEVYKRYSDFLTLHRQLIKFFKDSDYMCPGCHNYLHSLEVFEFPKKHIFASKTPVVINYRLKALRSFLNTLSFWAFSDAPKCPTCGGCPFELVCNFLLDNAEAITGSDIVTIRSKMVLSTFTGLTKTATALKSDSTKSANGRSIPTQEKSHKPRRVDQTSDVYDHFDDCLQKPSSKPKQRGYNYSAQVNDSTPVRQDTRTARSSKESDSSSLHGTFHFYNDDTSLTHGQQPANDSSFASNTTPHNKRGILKNGSAPNTAKSAMPKYNSSGDENSLYGSTAQPDSQSHNSAEHNSKNRADTYSKTMNKQFAHYNSAPVQSRHSKSGEGLWQPWELANA